MYVCICMYIYIYRHMNVNVCMHEKNACIHVCMYVWMYTYMYVWLHRLCFVEAWLIRGVYIHIYIYIYIYVCMYVYTYIDMGMWMYVCMNRPCLKRTHKYIHTYSRCTHKSISQIKTEGPQSLRCISYIHTYTHIHTHTCMHAYICNHRADAYTSEKAR